MKKLFTLLLCFGVFSVGLMYFQTADATSSFTLKFGVSNSGNIDSPSDVALSVNGKTVYVADSANNRIMLFDNVGNYVSVIGSFGVSDGQFNKPTVVKTDSSGNLFVVDSQNHRVQKFDSNGIFKLKFGSSDSTKNEYLGNPSGLAIQKSSGSIFVADSIKNSISVFSSSGQFLYKFGPSITNNVILDNPSALFIDDSDEMLYVANTNGAKIQIFKLNANTCTTSTLTNNVCFIKEIGTYGSSDGQFRTPSGLSLDTSNDILYVSDSGNDRVQIFKLNANTCTTSTLTNNVCFLESFGKPGSSNSEFKSPSGLIFDSSNGLLYVSDTGNDRVQVFKISLSAVQNAPNSPTGLTATPISSKSILLTWNGPSSSSQSITGYKIELKTGTGQFTTLVADTKSAATYFISDGLSASNSYYYRVSAINSQGTSNPSSTVSASPTDTKAPTLTAVAISPTQIKLSWFPPSNTFNQSISGYTIKKVLSTGDTDDLADVGGTVTTYTVNGLTTDNEYKYVVAARFSIGGSPDSNQVAVTPRIDSKEPPVPSSLSISLPGAPKNLVTSVKSPTAVNLSWSAPTSDGNSPIIGYKVESKKGTGAFSVLVDNTEDLDTTYIDSGLSTGVQYTYRVSAINSVGTGQASNESTSTPSSSILQINPIGKFTTEAKKTVSFTIAVTGTTNPLKFSLVNPPPGAAIDSNGKFTWTPTVAQAPGTATFDILVSDGISESKTGVSITVNEAPKPVTCNANQELVNGKCLDKIPTCTTNQELVNGKCVDKEPEPPKQIPAPFVDPKKDPQYYVDRYNNEPAYKEWFDTNYQQYSSIYEAVGLDEPKQLASFVDPKKDPQYYVDRYNNEPAYKEWFDTNYQQYSSIYEAVGLDEPKEPEPNKGQCGEGTKFVNGTCVLVTTEKKGGGCLIATAAYGSELAPQVQHLREIRDGHLLQTSSGSSFMSGFNQFYYSFSPTVADWERENPAFKEFVKISLTPMLSSLSLLNFVDFNSDANVLSYGIGLILLNIGMYFVAPVIAINRIRKMIK